MQVATPFQHRTPKQWGTFHSNQYYTELSLSQFILSLSQGEAVPSCKLDSSACVQTRLFTAGESFAATSQGQCFLDMDNVCSTPPLTLLPLLARDSSSFHTAPPPPPEKNGPKHENFNFIQPFLCCCVLYWNAQGWGNIVRVGSVSRRHSRKCVTLLKLMTKLNFFGQFF